jgi:DNA-binding NarL/FixJ family response regulator
MLQHYHIDVLLLDISVPTSKENSNPFPILYTVPKLLQKFPNLAVLVISMLTEPGLTRLIMKAGANGYLLKDDREAFCELGNIVLSVARGEVYFSGRVHDINLLVGKGWNPTSLTLHQLKLLSLCTAYPDMSTWELAQMMCVSHSNLRNLLSHIYLSLGVHSRGAAVEKVRELGLITPRPRMPGILLRRPYALAECLQEKVQAEVSYELANPVSSLRCFH